MENGEGRRKKRIRDVYHNDRVHHTCEQAIVEDRAITLSIEAGGQLSLYDPFLLLAYFNS